MLIKCTGHNFSSADDRRINFIAKRKWQENITIMLVTGLSRRFYRVGPEKKNCGRTTRHRGQETFMAEGKAADLLVTSEDA